MSNLRPPRFLTGFLLLALLFPLAPGCVKSRPARNGGGEGTVKNAEQVEAKPDDPAAVAQLEAAGFKLERNQAGLVTQLSVAREEESAELLALLKGLPNLRIVKLSGAGIQDAGLDSLITLQQLDQLHMTGSGLTDVGMKSIGQVANLRVFAARLTGITDVGIADSRT